jgi:hypothetical protein
MKLLLCISLKFSCLCSVPVRLRFMGQALTEELGNNEPKKRPDQEDGKEAKETGVRQIQAHLKVQPNSLCQHSNKAELTKPDRRSRMRRPPRTLPPLPESGSDFKSTET